MDWSQMIFQGWDGVVRTVVVGVMAYGCLVLFLRISGKRTLAKLNAFDLVVTVALGSTLSSILLQQSVGLARGATALGLLILMQYLVTFLSVRSRRFARFVRSEPALLARDGRFCRDSMLRQRITEEEVTSAIRSNGAQGVEATKAVILESDGSISVVGVTA